MPTEQERRAREFIKLIARNVKLHKRGDGYDLEKPGVKPRVGFVRFNVGGQNKGKYRIYAYEPFADPQGMFENDSEAPTGGPHTRGWNWAVHPDNTDSVEYAISVLQSAYDQR